MWEIYAYQNSASLYGIFNAAAAIHASGDYLSAIAAVAFCGFVAALFAYAFAPEKLLGWKWLGSVVLVFSLLIVPKVTVGIVDKTGSTPVQVVDNVPFGIAVLGSLTSTIGHTLTGLFETAFQTIPGDGALPSELAYAQHGLMFGNRLIRETGNVVFQDPNFRTDTINYLLNCTVYDLIDGTIDPTTFSTSPDVWSLIGTPNPARFSTLSSPTGSNIDTCPNVYLSLNNRLPAQLNRIQGKLAFQLNPTLPGSAASAAIAGQVQQAYMKNRIADAASTAADLIRQNAVLNVVHDAGKLAGQRANDPAAMVLAVGRAQATAQQNAAWINYGKVAEQALPVFRNVIEAITYAMFPLFVLLLLLTSGKETMTAFKGYANTLIWIQLWPPLYAVLNYMAATYAAYDLAAAADLGTGTKSLSLQTASTIYSRAISGEAVVGYLSMSIPFIAWSALKRMENLGTALVGGLSGLQAALSGATGAAATGNISMGNVAMDQTRLAPNRTSAFMGSLQDDISGNTLTSNALSGRAAMSLLRNEGFASRVVSTRVSEQDVNEASRMADSARSEAISANRERSAALTETFARGLGKLQSIRQSDGTTESSYEQLGGTLNRLDQISKRVAESTGLSQSQVANTIFGLPASYNYTKRKGSHATSGGVNTSSIKSYIAGLSEDERKILDSMTSEQVSEFQQFGDRLSRDNSLIQAIAADSREAQEMASRLSTTTALAQRADAAHTERVSYAERLSSARERGESITIDIAQDPHNLEMFRRYAEQYGGNSASAFTLMDSELARQGLSPNRTFSDGTAVPDSFGGIQMHHAAQRGAVGRAAGIAQSHQGHRDAVSAYDTALPPIDNSPAPSTLRDDVRSRGTEIKQQTEGAREKFDQEAQIVETDDGTLASRKSLGIQSGKQVLEDSLIMYEETRDTTKSLYQRAKDAIKKKLDDE
jgi:conjugal transfer mating pair stabilization protein TraG